MEQITVDKQNCCVILQAGSAVLMHVLQELVALTVTDPDNTAVRRHRTQTEFTRDWRASVRLCTKLYKKKSFLRRRHNLQSEMVPVT